MRILAVSDIHQSTRPHRGIDESNNFAKFLKVVKKESPDLILICGDTENITNGDIRDLKKTNIKTFIILGNHDIPQIIMNSGMFIDGVQEFNGVIISGISGIVSPSKRDYVLKFPKETIISKSNMIGQDLTRLKKRLDILMTHEMPRVHYRFEDRFYDVRSSSVFGDVLYLLKPKLAISGHLHGNETLVANYEYGTLINLGAFTDGHYAIIEAKENPFEINKIVPVDF